MYVRMFTHAYIHIYKHNYTHTGLLVERIYVMMLTVIPLPNSKCCLNLNVSYKL